MSETEKKQAYITFIFENNTSYLKGLFVLSNSLRHVKSRFPLVVVVPNKTNPAFIEQVKKYSLNSDVILMDDVGVSLHVKSAANKYWELTAFRFNIARLIQFDKVVMIDLDMLVLQNIDDVFDYPHLSGVCSAQIVRPHWVMPNGGLLVFNPSLEYYNQLLSAVKPVRELTNNNYNDQDVFYYTMDNWVERKELHIPEQYNEWWECVGKLAKTLPNGWRDIKVIHYWGEHKLWDYSKKQRIRFYIGCIHHLRFDLLKAARLYWKSLNAMMYKL